MFDSILAQFATLLGFAAMVSVIINILKYFKVVKDGTADKWVAGFNFLGVLALFIIRLVNPDLDISLIDKNIGQFAIFAQYVLSFIVTLLGSKATYLATKGLPLIGKSNTEAKG